MLYKKKINKFMIFLNNKQIKYNDISFVYNNWKTIDKEDFYNYKKNIIFSNYISKNYKTIKTSGSSSCFPKEYKWGPNFHEHWVFYNKLFFNTADEFFHLLFLPNYESKNFYRIGKNKFLLSISDSVPKNKDKILSNTHISVDPEVLYIYLNRYGDFISDFFDKKTCIFAFSFSALKKEHKSFFNSLDLKYKDYMRCWDGGATYYTCKYMNKHWADFSSIIKIENNKLISTDLWNTSQKFINYWNKDKLTSRELGKCECGMTCVEVDWENNPRYFVFQERDYCYDSFVEIAKKHGNFDYLFIEYNQSLIIINICCGGDFELNSYKNQIKKRLNISTIIVKKSNLPKYERKFLRIQQIPDNYNFL